MSILKHNFIYEIPMIRRVAFFYDRPTSLLIFAILWIIMLYEIMNRSGELMIYEIEYMPRFRESGHDALIGLKGYMSYFQDSAAGQYHSLGKSNAVIHKRYGAAWVYSKYKLKIYDKTDFDRLIKISAWISDLDKVRSLQEMEIKRGEELICEGRLESCLIDINDLRISRLSRIELPDGLVVDKTTGVGSFTRRLRYTDDCEYRYTHTVRYSEIDNNRHMNNLHYVDMFMDAFDIGFYDRNFITGFELHFLAQAYYGEELDVYVKEENGEYRLFALNKSKTPVAACVIEVKEN